jgi:hypothetical protein
MCHKNSGCIILLRAFSCQLILEASLDRAVAIDDIYQSSALLDQLIQQQIDQGIKMLHRVFMPAD